MKKFTLILILLILFTNCSQDNIANDSERNWCIGKIQRSNDLTRMMKYDSNQALRTEWSEISSQFNGAVEIYNNDSDSLLDLSQVKTGFLSNDEEALRLCKIWTDIAEYKE